MCQTVRWVKPKLFFNKIAAGGGNDFVEVTEEMTLEKFKVWIVEALWRDLSLRNKSSDGDFETTV